MNNYILPTFLLLFLIFSSLYLSISQKPGIGYSSLLKEYKEAQKYYDKATDLSGISEYGPKEEALEKEWNQTALTKFIALYKAIPSGLPMCDSLRFYTAFKIGELHHYFENFSEAAFYYQQSIAIKQNSALPDSLLFKPYLYGGIIFYNQNKFDTAAQFFKNAESVQASYKNKLSEGERLYNVLGVLYYEQGNYKQAQNYFQKALNLLPTSHAYYNELFVNYNINLAQMHLRLEEFDKANEIYLQLLPRKINLNEIHHNIGSLNLSLGAASKAIEFFRKVNYNTNKVVRLYNSLGEAFFQLRQFDSSIYYYHKAIKEYHSFGANTDPVGYGLVLKNLGHYSAMQKKYTDALKYFQQAIHRFYPAFMGKDVSTNPERFSGVFSYINLFNALSAKAEAWHNIYLLSNDITAAKEELKVYQSAFRLIEYVEQTYDSDEARLFLTKTKHAVHGKPIDIAFELYRKTNDNNFLEALYLLDQQNKAAVLSLHLRVRDETAKTSSPYLKKDQEVKTEITRLSIRAAQITDSLQLKAINSRIRDAEIELGKNREKMFPASSWQTGNVPPVSFLQRSLLDNKTALVSYHLSEEKITSLIITKRRTTCHQQPLPRGFSQKLQQQIIAIKTSPAIQSDTAQPGYYNLLLFSVPLNEIEQLVIIPDDALAYFPFETLKDKEGKFLIEKVSVQYQFSTTLLNKNNIDFSNAHTLSFAPFVQESFGENLPQLPESGHEVAGLKGRQFLNAAATKTNFLLNKHAYKIIHLATHAVANDSAENLSYIAFSPKHGQEHFLYAQEIDNLQLQNTGLVILSACETGAGKLVNGEGVLSLSRAFSYAGCPNIITSLWKADDFSTANLTSRIHHYLAKGYSVAKAVQHAKIDYLNDKKINPRLKQPYYWSHLVFIGNYMPAKEFNWTWFIIAGLIGLIVIFILLKRPAMPGNRHS